MIVSCIREVSSPINATSLLVDLRNFTPNLNAASEDDDGVNRFCHFLAEFYSLCLDACLVALPNAQKRDPPFYASSTGDGVLIIFTHDSHAIHGYLTALIINIMLKETCKEYNRQNQDQQCPRTSFGIGIESGPVSQIRAYPDKTSSRPVIDTFIGPCINVAARVESMTKHFHQTNTIVSENTLELLCNNLFDESYNALVDRALNGELSDTDRFAIHDKMDQLNRWLRVTFIHSAVLKGVDKPIGLYRVADSVANMKNEGFRTLLGKLTTDTEHYGTVIEFVSRFV